MADQLVMVGLTHRHTPLALLEQVAVPRAGHPALLADLRAAGWREAVLLSTCSRTEVYATRRQAPERSLLDVLARHTGVPLATVETTAEHRTDQAVVGHLLRVTAGLESRVIGEVEIQGQVRSAFRTADAAGLAGPTLTPLFAAAARCGQQVREQTTLGAQGRSLARRAVEIGLAALPEVSNPVIMVVGSGRMAATAVEHLRRLGRQPRVAARDEARAERLAGAGNVCPLPALVVGIARADLLICATSAAQHVVTAAHVREATARRTRPLVVVDLSVPRNVDTAVAGLPGVRLVDLEGLDDDPAAVEELDTALRAGRAIVAAAERRHAEGIAARAAGPVIAALRQRVEQTCLSELRRLAGSRLVAEEDLTRAAHTMAGRLLHAPTMAARAAAAAGDTRALQVLCTSFGLPLRV